MFRANVLRSFRSFRSTGGLRFYHSLDHEGSNSIVNSDNIEANVLSKSLKLIPKYGFSELCITQALRELDYSESLLSMFTASPSGSSLELQLMLFWLQTQRQRLTDEVLNPKSKFHSIKEEYDRISFLINKRLEYNIPVVNQLGEGLSNLIIPYNVNKSLEELRSLSDDIAFYAGDQSVDLSWYSKRFSVSSIYVASELYMLQDSSEEYSKTKEFVNDKVASLSELGDTYNSAEQWTFFNAISLVNLIKSQLLRG